MRCLGANLGQRILIYALSSSSQLDHNGPVSVKRGKVMATEHATKRLQSPATARKKFKNSWTRNLNIISHLEEG